MRNGQKIFCKEGFIMLICGLQKVSMVDYPEKIASTIFTGGCNLRCPYCHNSLLVTRLQESETIKKRIVMDYLKNRVGLIDAVVISGGEPLIYGDEILEFIKQIKSLGYLIKLDTNGTFPETLEKILSEGIVDYVAMDIKNSPDHYGITCGDVTLIDNRFKNTICKSIDIIKRYYDLKEIDYEFRTTTVKGFQNENDFKLIGEWLKGSPKYYIQNFVNSGNLINKDCSGFTEKELIKFKKIVEPYFGSVEIRGI